MADTDSSALFGPGSLPPNKVMQPASAGSAPSGAPQTDEYSNLLGETGGNAITRYFRGVNAAQTGMAFKAAQERHQQRQKEQDSIIGLMNDTAKTGLPISPELQKYGKAKGVDPELFDVYNAISQQQKQAWTQQDAADRQMYGLTPEEVGEAPSTGAGQGALPPAAPPAASGPASVGGAPMTTAPVMGADGQVDYTHQGTIDHIGAIHAQDPQAVAFHKQAAIATYLAMKAARRGDPTAAVQMEQAKSLQKQYNDYVGKQQGFANQMGLAQYNQGQENERAKAGREATAANERATQQGENERQKRSATQADRIEMNKAYEDIGKRIEAATAGGSGTKALTADELPQFIQQTRQELRALDQQSNDLGLPAQGTHYLVKLQPAVAGTGLRGTLGYGTPSQPAQIVPDTDGPSNAPRTPQFKAGDTRVKNGVTYIRNDKGEWHPQTAETASK